MKLRIFKKNINSGQLGTGTNEPKWFVWDRFQLTIKLRLYFFIIAIFMMNIAIFSFFLILMAHQGQVPINHFGSLGPVPD